MLENKRAVLFDLDGTLADSMWMWRQIDIDYLARFGKEFTPDLQRAIDGKSIHETAVYMKARYEIPDTIEKMQADWNDMARQFYRERVPLKDGALELLRGLKERGIRIGIGTSNSRELTEEVLHLAGGSGTWRGTGGMATKLNAAGIAMAAGVEMVITNGSRMEDIYGIVAGQPIGTRFLVSETGRE